MDDEFEEAVFEFCGKRSVVLRYYPHSWKLVIKTDQGDDVIYGVTRKTYEEILDSQVDLFSNDPSFKLMRALRVTSKDS